MTSALQIPALIKMHQAGFNSLVLRHIEDSAIMQAVEMRMMKGVYSSDSEDLVRFSASLLPQGVELHQLYAETKAGLRDHPAEELSLFAEHLERVAGDLEFAGARLVSSNAEGTSTTGQFAIAQHTLAERYADIIDAASAIEQQGGGQAIHMLAPITERPIGALEPFYDKAMALLAQRTSDKQNASHPESLR